MFCDTVHFQVNFFAFLKFWFSDGIMSLKLSELEILKNWSQKLQRHLVVLKWKAESSKHEFNFQGQKLQARSWSYNITNIPTLLILQHGDMYLDLNLIFIC